MFPECLFGVLKNLRGSDVIKDKRGQDGRGLVEELFFYDCKRDNYKQISRAFWKDDAAEDN